MKELIWLNICYKGLMSKEIFREIIDNLISLDIIDDEDDRLG